MKMKLIDGVFMILRKEELFIKILTDYCAENYLDNIQNSFYK